MNKKRPTRAQIMNEALESLTWVQRQKVIEAGRKFQKPADLAEVERLYYRALGLTEQEIERRMVMIHELKVWPVFFAKFPDKRVEIRKNDRDFKVGDVLNLREYDPGFNPKMDKVRGYTGHSTRATITDIIGLDKVPGIEIKGETRHDFVEDNLENFVALSLRFEGDVESQRAYPENVRMMATWMTVELTAHESFGPADHIKLTGDQCLDRLRQNVHELEQAMIDLPLGKGTPGTLLAKASAVANYAMFCAQVAGALKNGE